METGENTPLLGGDSSKRWKLWSSRFSGLTASSLQEKFVLVIASSALLTSLLSIKIFISPTPVLISSALSLLLAPYTAWQQQKISQAQSRLQVNQVLQAEVESLELENQHMQEQIRQAQENVSQTDALQTTLAALQQLSQSTLRFPTISAQLSTYRVALKEKQRSNRVGLLVQKIAQPIVAMGNSTDDYDVGDDSNLMLSDSEIDEMIQSFDELPGVNVVDEDRIRKLILDEGRSVGALLALLRNVLVDDDDTCLVVISDDTKGAPTD